MLLKIGNWFEMEVDSGVFGLVRVGFIAICTARTDKPKSYFDMYKEGTSFYLLGLGREMLISTKG